MPFADLRALHDPGAFGIPSTSSRCRLARRGIGRISRAAVLAARRKRVSGTLDAALKYGDQESPGEFQTPFSTHTHPISYVTIP